MGSWNEMGWLGMGVGMLIWGVVLVVVVWLIVRGLMALERREPSRDRGDSAEEFLRRRFASGEIDSEEYDSRLSALRR